jgi:hypothetical protein
VLGVPLGLVDGGLDGSRDVPPVGVPVVPPVCVPGVPSPEARLLLVCAEGCADGFLPADVA